MNNVLVEYLDVSRKGKKKKGSTWRIGSKTQKILPEFKTENMSTTQFYMHL
jgi:hypothetical protein